MLESLLLIIGVTTLCMLSPGPDMVLVMRNTLRGDQRTGLATSLGILSGNSVHIAYCALGVGVVVAHSIALYGALKLAGAAYLVFLGCKSLCGRPLDPQRAAVPRQLRRGAYAEGLLNNLLNPKGALFYLGVFTQVIEPGTPLRRTLLLILAMVLTSALFWVVFVATLHLPPVRALFARFGKTLDRVIGALLIALGLRVATQD